VIHALDHVVIAVRDLDVGVAAYQRLLDRPPCWRAEAAGGGAETAVFQLANVAAELIAPVGDSPAAARLRAVLDAQGEGLASLAFAVDDMERAHRRLTRLGLEPEPITAAESVDRATGARLALDVVSDDQGEVILHPLSKDQPHVTLIWPVDEFLAAFERIATEPEPVNGELFA